MPSRRASGDSSLLRSNNDRKSRAVATAMLAATVAAEIRREVAAECAGQLSCPPRDWASSSTRIPDYSLHHCPPATRRLYLARGGVGWRNRCLLASRLHLQGRTRAADRAAANDPDFTFLAQPAALVERFVMSAWRLKFMQRFRQRYVDSKLNMTLRNRILELIDAFFRDVRSSNVKGPEPR